MSYEIKRPTIQHGTMRIERCPTCDGYYHSIEGHFCVLGDHVQATSRPATRSAWSNDRQVHCLCCGHVMVVVPLEEQYGLFPLCPACWARKDALPIHDHWITPGPKETASWKEIAGHGQ